MEYILYKEPVSLDTLHIVQYLHANGITLLPKYIIERNHGHGVPTLPTIACNNKVYAGLSEVVKFYENASGISDLLNKARTWKEKNPNYRINDNL
jgi:hypothetical protein